MEGPGKTKAAFGRSPSRPQFEGDQARAGWQSTKEVAPFAGRLKSVDWRDLELFLEVAEAGSLRAGAVATRHNVATIRRRLGRMEDKLGEPLADRNPSGLRLTPGGEQLLLIAREMRRLRQSMESAERPLEYHGRVRIAVTEGLGTYWLMPRLVEFQRTHPELEIMLHCDMQRSDVASGACDLAIQLEAPQNTRMISERLGTLHLMPFASDLYLRQAGTPKSVDEWPRHRLVWQEADQVASHLLPYVLGTSEAVEAIGIRTNTSSAHFRAIASGGGIGILPTYARAVSRRVRPLEIGVHLRREIFCISDPERHSAAGVQSVLAWLRASFDGGCFPWFADEFIHPRDFEAAISSPNVISMFEGFIDAHDVDDG